MTRTIRFFLTIALLCWFTLGEPARARAEKKTEEAASVAKEEPASEIVNVDAEASGEEAGASVHSSAIAPTEAASGEMDIAYQGYFNRVNASTVATVGGASFSLKQFFPERGLFQLRLEPVADGGGVSAGENYANWAGLPWKGRYWDFSLGDFRVNTAMHPLPFTNLAQPEFYLRGTEVSARTSSWRYSLYGGVETLAQGPRIPFRDMVPQMAMGAEASSLRWKKVDLGFRYLHLLPGGGDSGSQNPLVLLSRRIGESDSFVAQTKINVVKNLVWYTEAGWSRSIAQSPGSAPSPARVSPFSFVAGPSLNTSHVILHANYVRQNESYMPLLGYFLGDREGTNVDAVLQFGWIGLSGSAGKTRNNLANNEELPSFTSRQAGGGLQLRLPLRFTLSAALSTIGVDSEYPDRGFERSHNRQANVSLTNSIFGHNLRASVQQLDLDSKTLVQRLQTASLEDNYHWKRFSLGGAVKLQSTGGQQQKDSLFFRATGQLQIRRFGLFAYVEQGKDLVNSTLFTKDTVATSVIGATWSSPRGFEIQAEALRNSSNTILNAENVFVLASQGIPLNSTLARFNNWSLYLKATQHFGWGQAISVDSRGEMRRTAPLTGTLQGVVKLKTLDGELPARGVWVVLDSGITVKTDQNGYFEVLKVSEGQHHVALNLDRLPAEMNPLDRTTESVVLFPERASRVEFRVVPLQGFVGTIRDLKGNPAPEGIVVRLTPGDQYTTTDQDGRFGFFNLPEGSYEASVDPSSLPEYGRVAGGDRIPVSVRYGKQASEIIFAIELSAPPAKPVQKLQLPGRQAPKAPPKPQAKPDYKRKMITTSSNQMGAPSHAETAAKVAEAVPSSPPKKQVYARMMIGAIR